MLVCTADVHWLWLLPLLLLLQLFRKRLQLKENIWEHEIFEVTWHYCWVTQGLTMCRQRSPDKKNFLTKRWPFFFFFYAIDVNIMRFLSQALYSIVTCARERVHYRLLALMQTMKLSNRLPIALTQKLEKMYLIRKRCSQSLSSIAAVKFGP